MAAVDILQRVLAVVRAVLVAVALVGLITEVLHQLLEQRILVAAAVDQRVLVSEQLVVQAL